ncbi:MAG TPA: acetate kinase [Spirochaetota bacterium]
MKILSINSGSSSLKFMLYDYEKKETLTTGIVERVGIEGSFIEFSTKDGKVKDVHQCPDHEVAIKLMMDKMTNPEYGIIGSMSEIAAVGHRVLHGGEKITESVIVTDEIIKIFKSLYDLGPLHMPPNVTGIEAARAVLPNVPHMAIMDTAFHRTMPESSYMYAVPYEWYDKYAIRRYGFHGTSHLYVSRRASVLLGKEPKDTNVVVLHIGNGASACAIKNGKCFDTSMGLTPLEGLVMGTRSGDLDPAILKFVCEKENKSPAEMDSILNKKAGLLGITGKFSDRRDVLSGAEAGDKRCQLAIDLEAYRLKKYIGAYIAAIGSCDAIIFTAGVGEFNATVREKAVEGLEHLGIKLDKSKNQLSRTRSTETLISADDSTIKIFVIPTDEETVFIEDVVGLLNGTYKDPSEFVYPFQKTDYVNKQREESLAAELAKNPKLKEIIAKPAARK